jgi:hypothetical protein
MVRMKHCDLGGRGGKCGLTLIELIAGFAAASILAVTAGVILFYIFSAWRRNLALVDGQQDVSVAMYALTRNIRGAQVLDASYLPGAIQVTNTAGVGMRFYVDGATRRLCQMPDVADPTRIISLSDFPVVSFASAQADDGLAVFLELEGSEGIVQNRSVIHMRN